METGRHAAFIWAAYGLAALIVMALVLHALFDYRAQRRALARLEERGGGRRASEGAADV